SQKEIESNFDTVHTIHDPSVNCSLPSYTDNQNKSHVLGSVAFSTPKSFINTSSMESSAPSGAIEIMYIMSEIVGDNWLSSNNVKSEEDMQNDEVENNIVHETFHLNEQSSANELIINSQSAVHDYAHERTNNKTKGLKIVSDEICTQRVILAIRDNNFVNSHKKHENKNETINLEDANVNQSVNNTTSERIDISNHETTNNNISVRKDSDYIPDENLTESCNNTTQSSHRKFDLNLSLHNKKMRIDNRELRIIPSKKSGDNIPSKKHFCKYCKQLRCKFGEHLIKSHKTEEDVRRALLSYPAKHPIRAKMITEIRNAGDYIHNTDPEFNTGIIITCRRPQAKFESKADDYVCCSTCQAYYSKKTLRLHHIKCNKNCNKGDKGQMVEGKLMMGYIHSRASQSMRTLSASFHDDIVSRYLKYDELIILYGNKLCEKYTLSHQNEMIRSYLRLLSRFTLAAKKLNDNITGFASILRPKFYDDSIEAIKDVSNFNAGTKPTISYNFSTLGTQIKKCCRLLITECIKKEDYTIEKEVERYVQLLNECFPILNKKCLEDMSKARREKQEQQTLPSKKDIAILYKFLKENCDEAMKILQKKFKREAWTKLCECTLILLQMFNRRRAEEIERFLITNYNKQETIEKSLNSEIYGKISKNYKEYADKYVRVLIRVKLGRTVPVLMDRHLIQCIDTILKYHERAGVDENNEYVFAIPNATARKKPYLRACPLMRKFSQECGATMPSSLRGTILRKHIATYTAMLGIENDQVGHLANFMGYAEAIHKNIYRVPTGFKDITEVSRLLVAAMEDDDDDDDDDDNEDDEVLDIEATSKTKQRNNPRRNICNDFNNTEPQPSTSTHQGSSEYNIPDVDTTPKSMRRSRSRNATYNNLNTSDTQQSTIECQTYPEYDVHQLNENQNDDIADDYDNACKTNKQRRVSPKVKSVKRKNRVIESDSTDNDESRSSILKLRNTSPYGKTRRIRWSDSEKQVVKNAFGDLKRLKVMPTVDECDELIAEHEVLQDRTGKSLRTWIDNQIRAPIRREEYHRRKLLNAHKNK
ncbi:hypothetical protein PV327_010993, partial [Microctonus hyperodae]